MESFEFEKSLNFSSFVFKYFDRVLFHNSLMVFFPKIISGGGTTVSIPPWNYYEARKYIFNRVENKGCIFLKKRLSKNNNDNSCILHSNEINLTITAKPIDCVFLNCSDKGSVITPTTRETSVWLSCLDYYFPNSLERFKARCPELPN